MELRVPLTGDNLTMTKVFVDNPQRILRRELSITLAQYRALAFIEKEGGMSPGVLASHLGQPLSKVSLNMSDFLSRGVVYQKAQMGPQKVYALTDEGARIYESCQTRIRSEYDRLLGFLDESQVSSFETGCFATAMKDGAFSYFGDKPDRTYMVLHAFYLSERLFTKASNEYRVNLNQFRLLWALFEAGGSEEYASLRRTLLMPSATMADAVKVLQRDNYIEPRRLDGRSKYIMLTESGEELASKVAVAIDDCLMGGIRQSSEAERALYVRAASDIVNGERHYRFKEIGHAKKMVMNAK